MDSACGGFLPSKARSAPDDSAGKRALPIRLSLEGEYFHIGVQIPQIRRRKQDPFSIAIGRRLVVLPAEGRGERAPHFLKRRTLRLTEDHQKAKAVFPRIQAAERLPASAVFVFIPPILSARSPNLFHFIRRFNGGTESLPNLEQGDAEQVPQSGRSRLFFAHKQPSCFVCRIQERRNGQSRACAADDRAP